MGCRRSIEALAGRVLRNASAPARARSIAPRHGFGAKLAEQCSALRGKNRRRDAGGTLAARTAQAPRHYQITSAKKPLLDFAGRSGIVRGRWNGPKRN